MTPMTPNEILRSYCSVGGLLPSTRSVGFDTIYFSEQIESVIVFDFFKVSGLSIFTLTNLKPFKNTLFYFYFFTLILKKVS
jgi:hypothetical protein